MSSFKDATGEKWKLRFTIGTIRKVKDDTDINIGLWLDDDMKVGREVMLDPLKMFLVLYSLCEEQCKERELSEEQFAERFNGDAVGDAREALWKAFLDFCPSQQKQILTDLQAKTEKVRDKIVKKLMDSDEKDLISFQKRTNVRESAESTRQTSRHAN